MVRSAEATRREAKVAELKRLITSRHFESLEMLEEAVEAFLWGEEGVDSLAPSAANVASAHRASITQANHVTPATDGCGPAEAAAGPC